MGTGVTTSHQFFQGGLRLDATAQGGITVLELRELLRRFDEDCVLRLGIPGTDGECADIVGLSFLSTWPQQVTLHPNPDQLRESVSG